jgi:hypothetical protein
MSDPASAKCPWRGFWGFCGNSWSIAWGYLQIITGTTLDVLNVLAVMPEFTDLVNTYGGPYSTHILKAFGVVTILCRLRTLRAS